ncbi:GM11384 [Drosophila sechellia]|uniref:GM11384 n=1 Tax=Drosophila sechellia TaxID=7238 RepID=B4IDJ0_DROSE|nr:GM11384 [Drosophila sechellia]
MLTDMTPTAGQLYGSQIPAMGMNISNIATHLQKPQVNPGERTKTGSILELLPRQLDKPSSQRDSGCGHMDMGMGMGMDMEEVGP